MARSIVGGKGFRNEPRTSSRRIAALKRLCLVGLVLGVSGRAVEWRAETSLDQFSQTAPIAPDLIDVPGGSYLVGDPGWPHTPVRSVRIQPFSLARFEVSNAEYDRFAAATGRRRTLHAVSEARRPVAGVSWGDAVAYADWLSHRLGRPYRLPTSVEWEVAARAGRHSAFEWGERFETGREPTANLADRSARDGFALWRGERFFVLAAGYDDGFAGTAPVGSFAPNIWGFFDMTGNVAEWCGDAYVDDITPGPGSFRAVRGSSFMTLRPEEARIGRVWAVPATIRDIAIGFRLGRSNDE